jgi:lipopolysaccharide/colanic/teichoic acid biosynthesis glycosyltransferase
MNAENECTTEIMPTPFWKRCFDIALSGTGLFCSSPLWLLVAIAIKMEDGGPVFYTQERVGLGGRIFKVYKFRSMIPDAEKKTGAVWATEHDPRVTKVGRVLRATAMDELPQLWSIFKGDMSFVGPRPERPALVREFMKEIPGFARRFEAQPGLTGVAQVYGKYDTPPKHKLRYDMIYLKNRSFGLDIQLILFSFLITFLGKWEDRRKPQMLRRWRRRLRKFTLHL